MSPNLFHSFLLSFFSSFSSFWVSTVQKSVTLNSFVWFSHLTPITCLSQQHTSLFDGLNIYPAYKPRHIGTHLTFVFPKNSPSLHLPSSTLQKCLKSTGVVAKKPPQRPTRCPLGEVPQPVSAECVWCKEQLFTVFTYSRRGLSDLQQKITALPWFYPGNSWLTSLQDHFFYLI